MSTQSVRLCDAETRIPFHTATLAGEPRVNAVLSGYGSFWRVEGVEHHIVDGEVLVFVTVIEQPIYTRPIQPASRTVSDLRAIAERMPEMFGCSRCGGVFVDRPGAREIHGRECPMLATPVGPCSDWSAVTCAVHGECGCQREEGTGCLVQSSTECPLHGLASTHAMPELAAVDQHAEMLKREAEVARRVERILEHEMRRGRQLVCQRCAKRWAVAKLEPCSSPWKAAHGEHDWAFDTNENAEAT